MALIACNECGTQISDKAAACVKCGAPVAPPAKEFVAPETGSRRNPLPVYEGGYTAPSSSSAQQNRPQLVKSAKSRGVYIILGLFFGLLGIHNFYAGRFGIGAAQLLTTCILGWFVVGLVVTAIWAIADMFLVKTDGAGDALA